MFSIISQIIEHSENFMSLLHEDIEIWIEFAAYKNISILTKLIQIIDKIIILRNDFLSE